MCSRFLRFHPTCTLYFFLPLEERNCCQAATYRDLVFSFRGRFYTKELASKQGMYFSFLYERVGFVLDKIVASKSIGSD